MNTGRLHSKLEFYFRIEITRTGPEKCKDILVCLIPSHSDTQRALFCFKIFMFQPLVQIGAKRR